MPSTINSDNGVSSGTSGLKSSGGNDGILTFQSSGTETMRIDASGNVGVGTTSPTAALSVSKITTALSGTSQPYGVHIYPTGSGLCYVDALTSSTSATSLGFRTYNNGNYNEVRIDSSGNLGIGTTAPAAKLQVSGGTTTELRVVSSGDLTTGAASFIRFGGSNNATSGYMGYGGVSSVMDIWNGLNGAMTFGTNNTERARIDSSGNLLVGATSTTWSGSRLTSAGTVSIASGASINLSSTVCGGAIVSVYVAGSGNGGLFFLNYSANAVKIAGDGSATDTGTDFAVYKNAASHTSTLKNKSGATQTFSVVVVAGQLS